MSRASTGFAFLCLLSLLILGPTLHAEPWLANRYSQNCAACHSPGRREVSIKERRCTMSCQSCHVNPSGGGIRTEYGVWNQQRWLRSFKSTTLTSKGMPAPLQKQKYGRIPAKLNPKQIMLMKKFAKEGPPLVVSPGVEYNPLAYDSSDKQDQIMVKSRAEFLARLPKEDPWRLERSRTVSAGGDFRYVYYSGEVPGEESGTAIKEKVDGVGPLAFDMGVKIRPTPKNLALVFESRFLNNPNTPGQESLEWAFTSGAQVRSAYVLANDFPYNTYVQYGLYRPLFGLYSPDANSLLNHLIYADNSQTENIGLQTRSARSINKALSIGASPNKPFLNLHWIQPMDNKSYPMSGESGFAGNVGARFETFGLSIMASYWSTKGYRLSSAVDELKTDMLSLSGGLAIKRFILNADFTRVEKEFAPGASDSGSVQTLESKFRVWRENYLILNYATANVNRSLKQGESGEMAFGIKSFLTSGTEFEFLMTSRTDKNATSEAATEVMSGQLHLFF